MAIEIRLSGADASALAAPAEELLRTIATTEPEQRKPIDPQEISKGDPVAVTALILSIPSAILATMDIVERAKVVERIRTLLQKIKSANATATLQTDNEPPLDLKDATEDEVMDLIAKRSA
jgi:hypothetical protein